MIKIFTTPSCASCRKAKKWLDEHEVSYEEKNILAFPITKEDIRLMLRNAENGFEDIISKRSKYIMENNIDIDQLKVSELERLIIEHPSILKRPIIIEDDKMQVGYNEDDIRVFIPKELRKILMCYDCDNCEYLEKLGEYGNKLKKYYYEQVKKAV